MKKMLKLAILLVIVGYVLIVATLYFAQESLIFLPESLEQDFEYSFATQVEEFNIDNKGEKLNALYFKAKNSKGVILYFHGNAGNLSRWGGVVEPFLKYNYDVIVMDYRGYGKNEGQFSEELMYSDASAFYEYAKNKYSENQIVVYGRSLGTTFATYVASIYNPEKLVLETPFYSLKSVVQDRFPFMPTDLMLNYNFETNKLVEEVKCSTLIFLASEDEVIPFENGLKLSEEFQKIKTLTVREASHNNIAQFDVYWTILADFLAH